MDRQQKRFEAAKAAMQGLLANQYMVDGLTGANDGNIVDVIAKAAVDQADALLTELAAKEVDEAAERKAIDEEAKQNQQRILGALKRGERPNPDWVL